MKNLQTKNKGIKWQPRIAEIVRNSTLRSWRRKKGRSKNNFKAKRGNWRKVKITMSESFRRAKP